MTSDRPVSAMQEARPPFVPNQSCAEDHEQLLGLLIRPGVFGVPIAGFVEPVHYDEQVAGGR
jgi:hypothetical protein